MKLPGYEVPLKYSRKQVEEDGKPKKIPALSITDAGFIELQQQAANDYPGIFDGILDDARAAAEQGDAEGWFTSIAWETL